MIYEEDHPDLPTFEQAALEEPAFRNAFLVLQRLNYLMALLFRHVYHLDSGAAALCVSARRQAPVVSTRCVRAALAAVGSAGAPRCTLEMRARRGAP